MINPNSRSIGRVRYLFCRISGDRGSGRNVRRDDRAGAYNCLLTNGDSAKQGRSTANARASFNDGWDYFPVRVGLERTAGAGCPRILVVDKGYVMADEYFVFDGDALTDEGVTRYFAISADAGALLNFDKRADPGAVTDLTAV